MKNIFKSVLVGTLSVVALTGCIDEVVPTDGVDQDQVDSSDKTNESKIMAMPGYMVQFNTLRRATNDEWHGDYGYASLMHVRDVMTGDMIISGGADEYNQYGGFSLASLTQTSAYTQCLWQYYYKVILTANKVMSQYPEDSESATDRGYNATARAFRALSYLDAARWFEYLPTDVTSPVNIEGNDVLHLTVPIVTEKTTEEEARNNPRVSRDKMAEFILEDLDYAEQNIANVSWGSKLLPDLACVYGLKARLYMWIENYPKAAEYAKLAIAQSGCAPLSKDEWVNPNTGFNTFDNPSWMWGMQFTRESEAVGTGICNWTSFMSFEAEYGYAAVGCAPGVSVSMYDRISDTDFRKLSWVPGEYIVEVDGEDGPHYEVNPLAYEVSLGAMSSLYSQFIDPEDPDMYSDYNELLCYNFPYAGLKFRPGYGNISDPNVGSSVGVPMMRVEEMYFIAMEAAVHTSANAGKAELVDFMTAYRDPEYICDASSIDDVVEEIVFQKRVELWGEGQAFWDIKRLNYSVIRSYPGSNCNSSYSYNTQGRPAWMNMIIVQSELDNNEAVMKWNNPNFAQMYVAVPIPQSVAPAVMSRATTNGKVKPVRFNAKLKKYRPLWINE